jgi:hypothetical protein
MIYHIAPFRFHKERIQRFLDRNPDKHPGELIGNIALFTSVPCVIVVELLKELGYSRESLAKEEQTLRAFYDAEVVE